MGCRRAARKLPLLKAGGALRKALFSPDGTLVLTTLNDGTARIWKTDGTEVRVLAGDKSRISAASFSPDGRLVATGYFDGTAQVWSVMDGSVVATLKGHRGAVNAIEFSRDGQSVIDGFTRRNGAYLERDGRRREGNSEGAPWQCDRSCVQSERPLRCHSLAAGSDGEIVVAQFWPADRSPFGSRKSRERRAGDHARHIQFGRHSACNRIRGQSRSHNPRLPDASRPHRLRKERCAPRTDAMRAQTLLPAGRRRCRGMPGVTCERLSAALQGV